MRTIDQVLGQLQSRHKEALNWFVQCAGTESDWPEELDIAGEQTLVVTKAKGIYKPSWTTYSLSVRQTLGGSYPDEEPIHRSDGTWSYKYFQENADPEKRDDAYTNAGLMACMRDQVPVGVLRQVSAKPNVKYRVLGLALVSRWEAGYFFLEGFSLTGKLHELGPAAEVESLAGNRVAEAIAAGAFDPAGIVEGRSRAIGAIVIRRGQPEFRRRLLEAYGGVCAISGCNAADALEAVHITPYRGPETNQPSNGLLLRADLHTLFDFGLLAVHETKLTVMLGHTLTATTYNSIQGRSIRVPVSPSLGPSPAALKQQREWAGL